MGGYGNSPGLPKEVEEFYKSDLASKPRSLNATMQKRIDSQCSFLRRSYALLKPGGSLWLPLSYGAACYEVVRGREKYAAAEHCYAVGADPAICFSRRWVE